MTIISINKPTKAAFEQLNIILNMQEDLFKILLFINLTILKKQFPKIPAYWGLAYFKIRLKVFYHLYASRSCTVPSYFLAHSKL